MKYSFMTFSTPQLTLEEILNVAKTYGYDGVEIRIDANHAHGVEVSSSESYRQRVKGLFEASGITPACVATSIKFADPEQTAEMLRNTRECIDLAASIGATAIRVFGGAIPKTIEREKAFEVVADSLSKVADYAGEKKVSICMETHDAWTNPAHVLSVIEKVNSPWVSVNWDVLHPVRTGKATIDESFELLKPYIRHCHIHDSVGTNNVMVPIGTGIIDHRRVIELLKTIGYTGFMSGEWINWEPYDEHLPRELKTLKGYEASLEK